MSLVKGATEEDFVNWAKGAGIKLQNLSWQSPQDLARLDHYLEGKRIVYLGEMDHWIHEKYDYRLLLIHYLRQKGWNSLGLEMGRSDGQRINNYLQTGDAAWLKKVALYGYQGALRKDRSDFPVRENVNPEFPSLFVNEEMWFATQLLEISRVDGNNDPFHFFGFDGDGIPGGGYEDLKAILADYKSPLIAELQKRITRVPNETVLEEISRLEEANQFLLHRQTEFIGILKNEKFSEVEHSLLNLRDSLEFRRVSDSQPSDSDMLKAFERREQTMFRELDWTLGQLGTKAKVILMGHAMHLGKDNKQLYFGTAKQGTPTMWPSIGTYLHKKYPGEVFAFWMLHHHGSHSNLHYPSAGRKIEASKNSIGKVLNKVAPAFLLPIGPVHPESSFLDRHFIFPTNGGGYSGNIYRNADCLFFLSEVSALRKR